MRGTVNGMQHSLEIGRTGEYSSGAGIAGIAVIDFDGLLFWNRMISVPFQLEYVEFGIFNIPGIPLPEKSQKEYDLSFAILTHPFSYFSGLCLRLLGLQRIPAIRCFSSKQYSRSPEKHQPRSQSLITASVSI